MRTMKLRNAIQWSRWRKGDVFVNECKYDFAQKIEEAFRAAESITGAQLCMTQNALSLQKLFRFVSKTQNVFHYTPYCRLCQQLDNKRACDEEHYVKIPKLSHLHEKPFLNVCHAGVLEAVIPIYYRNQLQAIALLSGVRTQAAHESPQVAEIAEQAALVGILRENIEEAFNAQPRKIESLLLSTAQMTDLCIRSIIKLYESLYGEARPDVHNLTEEACEMIVNGIHTNELTISDISRKLGVSRGYLFRLFKRDMKISMCGYIRQVRIERACLLLTNTNMSMQDISVAVGIGDQNYFSRMFFREMHVTPTQYRQMNGKNHGKIGCLKTEKNA